MDWILIALGFPPQSFEKPDKLPGSVALLLDRDLEDLILLKMSDMTLLLGTVTTANLAEKQKINSTSRYSFAVRMSPEKFQTEDADESWWDIFGCLVQLTVIPVIFPIICLIFWYDKSSWEYLKCIIYQVAGSAWI